MPETISRYDAMQQVTIEMTRWTYGEAKAALGIPDAEIVSQTEDIQCDFANDNSHVFVRFRYLRDGEEVRKFGDQWVRKDGVPEWRP